LTSSNDALLLDLRGVVGGDHVLTDADMVAGYVRDWTRRWTGHTEAVVRPRSVEEVQAVVEICRRHSVPLVPQGGNTGLVGGSIPHRGEVVLSLRRLDRLEPVDVRTREVVVGAGVTLGAVQEHARRSGLGYGVDLASRDTATIGGNIATNAGGANVVANGDTRRQVLGLEAVLSGGSLLTSLDRVVKESTGPDPLQLLIGSEGSLGVITAARLRLVELPTAEPVVTLVAVASLEEGMRFVTSEVHAVEFFDEACLDLVMSYRGLSRPITAAPFYVLIESSELPDAPDSGVVDRRLWAYREAITETINQAGIPVKIDVAVPHGRVDEFATAVRGLDLDGEVYLFGHLAEANFHVNVLGCTEPDSVIDEVLRLVVSLGGAIASEHGIGVAKADWWRRSSDPALIAVSRSIKEALDPAGIFNPAVFWGG